MGVASECGEQEVGVVSGSGWNLWMWLLGVVVRRCIDFLILHISTPLVYVLFCSTLLLLYLFFFAAASLYTLSSFFKCFSYICIYIYRGGSRGGGHGGSCPPPQQVEYGVMRI